MLVVNGARPTNNNFTLDGVDNNEGNFGQIGIYPTPDTVSEFKIETSVAPAEGGRAGGGIINTTTKSGGNSVHGTLYEFYQGRVGSALSRTERTVPLHLTNRNTHQYGGTAGHYASLMGGGSLATEYDAAPWLNRARRHTGALFG